MKFIISMILQAVAAASLAMVSCGGQGSRTNGQESTGSAPVQYTYLIKNVFPHSTDSYTQGLYWHDGYLWEGTGQRGESALKKVVLETGQVLTSVPLSSQHFGEGIALLGDKIYQLTWDSGKVFVYDASTLELTGTFDYKGEGWGLTTDGEVLYMSDGTDRIYVVDPVDFTRTSIIYVKSGNLRVQYLNELEWIGGKIWANIYMSESLVIIDPQSGAVEGIVDLTGILPRQERRPYTDVLNGIAYDPDAERVFVTGKYWHKLFEIDIVPKNN